MPIADLGGRRARRPSLVVVGLLVVCASALAGALALRATSGTAPALVMARPLARGDVVVATDLRVVDIEPSPGLAWMPASEQGQIIDSAARGPVVAGQLVSGELFGSPQAAIGPGRVVVAAALRPGDLPESARPGDGVRIHVIGSGGDPPGPPPADGGSGRDMGARAGSQSLGRGLVWSVTVTGGGTGGPLVELLIDDELESAVTQAAATGRLKLNLVGGDG